MAALTAKRLALANLGSMQYISSSAIFATEMGVVVPISPS
jgi:hypothetical protein